MTPIIVRQFVCSHQALLVFGWYTSNGHFLNFFHVGVN